MGTGENMKFMEIEQSAHQNVPLPAGARHEELICYLCLRNLYRAYQQGVIPRDAAAEEKRYIRRAYEETVRDHNRQIAMYCQYQENIRQAETLMHEISKGARNGEPVEALFEKASRCIAAMTHNDVFHELNMRYLKEKNVSERMILCK